MRSMTEQATVIGPNQFTIDSGEVDAIRWRNEDGKWQSRPIKASDEELRQREIDALKREVAGIEHRLEHLDDPPPPWDPFVMPNEATVERVRSDLENTRDAIFTRLETLNDQPEPAPAKKRNR